MSRGPPATRGAISVRPEPCRRVGVWPFDAAQDRPFDAAPIPFGVWGCLGAPFDAAQDRLAHLDWLTTILRLRCSSLRTNGGGRCAQDARRGTPSVRPEPCRRVGGWSFDAAPIPFALSCVEGFGVAWGRPSTRLRTGLPIWIGLRVSFDCAALRSGPSTRLRMLGGGGALRMLGRDTPCSP